MKYNYKKTLEKVGYTGLFVIIAGMLSVYADQPWLLAIAPMLQGLQNWLKHRKDTSEYY